LSHWQEKLISKGKEKKGKERKLQSHSEGDRRGQWFVVGISGKWFSGFCLWFLGVCGGQSEPLHGERALRDFFFRRDTNPFFENPTPTHHLFSPFFFLSQSFPSPETERLAPSFRRANQQFLIFLFILSLQLLPPESFFVCF
jgi:hypothetical protein